VFQEIKDLSFAINSYQSRMAGMSQQVSGVLGPKDERKKESVA
jgi:hypothetical protein